ncbi:MAG TPA: hypothetical protein VGL39_23100 [Jatrophihabitantaceae bacterium]
MSTNRLQIAVAAVAAAGLTGLVAPRPTSAAPTPTDTAVAAAPAAVVLPTGERIQISGAGPNQHVIVRHDSGAPRVQVLRVGGHTYAIPIEANTSELDLSMFDVAQLAQHQDRIPVSLRLTGATVPGVTITSRSGSSAKGYVTPASAAQFGAALRAGRGNVPGLARISLDVPRPATVTPAYQQYTLDVKVKPPAGVTPDLNRLFVVNADDARKLNTGFNFTGDDQRISVPEGHYILMAQAVSAPTTEGAPYRGWTVFRADVTVTGDGQTVVLDTSRATTSPYPTFTDLPRPATEQSMNFAFGVSDDRGKVALNFSGWRDLNVEDFVQSGHGGRHGKFSTVTWAQLNGPSSAPNPYGYYLAQAHANEVVGDERINASQSHLATVQAHYYGDGRALVGFGGRTPVLPYLDPGLTSITETSGGPAVRTEYVYSPPGAAWVGAPQQELSDFSAVIGELNQARAFRAGQTYREDFFHGPLAPGAFSQPGPAAAPYCQACRTATMMQLGVTAFNDSDPSHVGWPFGGSPDQSDQHMQVRQDGTVIFDQDSAFYGRAPSFDIAAGDHDYRVIGTFDGAADGQIRSTHATTEWGFRSTSADPEVPSDWVCAAAPATPCTVLPMLTVSYAMPTSLTGTMAPGTSSFGVTVGHVQAAAATPTTGLSFSVAVDGGALAPQQVRSLGGGRYLVTVVNPAVASGTGMTVSLHATDAAGGSITQTVQTAYTIAGS